MLTKGLCKCEHCRRHFVHPTADWCIFITSFIFDALDTMRLIGVNYAQYNYKNKERICLKLA